mmetsp:Transcript_19857/g.30242  ORF Transcript_19857/g.30242 Transcript_19857/m.30242 type:complete len:385 (+) Transcript_19857:126-1280(+)
MININMKKMLFGFVFGVGLAMVNGQTSCVPNSLKTTGCTAQSIIDALLEIDENCTVFDNQVDILNEACEKIKANIDDQRTYNLATGRNPRLRPLIRDEEELSIFFMGGGDLNLKRDNENDKLQNIARKINQVYTQFAQDERIAYPRTVQFHQDDTYTDTDPDLVYPNCAHNVLMCCFSSDRQANDDNGNCAEPYDENCVDADPADNTDICYADHSRLPQASRVAAGLSIFKDEEEGDTHCHGMVWSDDIYEDQARYAGNNLFYISMYDHLYTRGYVENIPGAPMCGCLEYMPTVSRSDCTEMDVTETFVLTFDSGELVNGRRISLDIEFNACNGGAANNDLESEIATYYDGVFPDELRKYITGPTNNDQTKSNCQAAIDTARAA